MSDSHETADQSVTQLVALVMTGVFLFAGFVDSGPELFSYDNAFHNVTHGNLFTHIFFHIPSAITFLAAVTGTVISIVESDHGPTMLGWILVIAGVVFGLGRLGFPGLPGG